MDFLFTKIFYMLYYKNIILDSSMVEQEAVNFEVVGSSPAQGAITNIFNNLGLKLE